MLNGEVVSPPAGAIGRGDAFVLRIAERTGATVLSNDSFQEFHGEHPWLFDDGRLIGGKPVPGRRLDLHAPAAHPGAEEPGGHRRGQGEEGPRVGAGQGRRAGQGGQEGGQEGDPRPARAPPSRRRRSTRSWPLTPDRAAARPGQGQPVFSSAIDEAVEEALHPPAPEKSRGRPRSRRRQRTAAPKKRAKAKKDGPRPPRRRWHGKSSQASDRSRRRAGGRAEARSSGRHRRRRSTSRWPSSTSSPPSRSGARSRARWCRSPRTGPWSTCRCPAAGRCTATSR